MRIGKRAGFPPTLWLVILFFRQHFGWSSFFLCRPAPARPPRPPPTGRAAPVPVPAAWLPYRHPGGPICPCGSKIFGGAGLENPSEKTRCYWRLLLAAAAGVCCWRLLLAVATGGCIKRLQQTVAANGCSKRVQQTGAANGCSRRLQQTVAADGFSQKTQSFGLYQSHRRVGGGGGLGSGQIRRK